MNWLLISGSSGSETLPYAIVNISGGLIWGAMARATWFSSFMKKWDVPLREHVQFLLIFGVLAAGVMGVAGTSVEMVLNKPGVPAFDASVSSSLHQLMQQWQPALRTWLAQYAPGAFADSVSFSSIAWVENTVKYIPDKTLSFALAVIVARISFPLFEQQLVQQRANVAVCKDTWFEPAALALALLPFTSALIPIYHVGYESIVWMIPLLVACTGVARDFYRSRAASVVCREAAERSRLYEAMMQRGLENTSVGPGPNFGVATMAASLSFVFVLPLLTSSVNNYFRIAFHFVFLVLGFQLLTFIYRNTLAQNIALLQVPELQELKPPPRRRANESA